MVRFELHVHEKDKPLPLPCWCGTHQQGLVEIQNFFGVGSISHNKNSVHYLVRSVSELAIIIKHFDAYPLLSKKYADFILFKSVINILNQKEHTISTILKIAAIKSSINKGLSDSLKEDFSAVVPALRPQANSALIPDPF